MCTRNRNVVESHKVTKTSLRKSVGWTIEWKQAKNKPRCLSIPPANNQPVTEEPEQYIAPPPFIRKN